MVKSNCCGLDGNPTNKRSNNFEFMADAEGRRELMMTSESRELKLLAEFEGSSGVEAAGLNFDLRQLVRQELDKAFEDQRDEIAEQIMDKISKLSSGECGPSVTPRGEGAAAEDQALLRSSRRHTKVLGSDYEEYLRSSEDQASDVEIPEEFSDQIMLELPNGKIEWGKEVCLGQDAYGAAMVLICRQWAAMASFMKNDVSSWRAWNWDVCSLHRSFFYILAFVANVFFTINVCFSVDAFLVEPYVRKSQIQYKSFHEKVFNQAGNFLPHKWEAYGQKTEVCEIAMSQLSYMYMIIALHVMGIVVELRQTIEKGEHIWSMRQCTSVVDMIHWHGGQEHIGKCVIESMTRPIRLVVSLVLFYKFAIGVVVLILGCRLLAASNNFSDVLLNALTLHFVVNIDNEIFDAFLPEDGKQAVENTVFFLAAPKLTFGMQRAKAPKEQKEAMFWICFCFAFVLVYVNVYQSVLPTDLAELRQICREHVKFPKACTMHEWQLQGDQHSCYPYGGHATQSLSP